MLKEEKIALTHLGKNKDFKAILEKVTLNQPLNEDEKVFVLSTSLLFLKHYEKNNSYTSYADFAYYLVLKYALLTDDYIPLYDFVLNFGYYPVAQEIIRLELIDTNSFGCAVDQYNLNKFRHRESYIETLEQRLKAKKLLADDTREKSFIAPTSFGKSSIIIDYIRKIDTPKAKVVIVVPTKSLLAQTYKNIKNANLKKKIIIHDEMYNNEDSFIAIFTQERSLRMLGRNDFGFDLLFIDEAHNILDSDDRSILLSRLLARNSSRNPNQEVVYLSPLIDDVNNLKLSQKQEISKYQIKFNVKEPELFELTLAGEVMKYNRFIGQEFDTKVRSKTGEYFINNSGKKNFVYAYSPRAIEGIANLLYDALPDIELTLELEQLKSLLIKEVHKDFYAVEYLKKGVLYIHGKMPELIKEYLESKFKYLPEIKYIVANKVILEGMNLPIDNLFILSTYNIQGKGLINLIGRVNRLNNVFNQTGNELHKLMPKVHFVNTVKFSGEKSKMINKIKLLRSRVFKDEVNNPILNSFDIDKVKAPSKEKLKEKKEKIMQKQKSELFLTEKHTDSKNRLKVYLIESGINAYYSDVDNVLETIVQRGNNIFEGGVEDWADMSMMDKIDYFFLFNPENVSDFEIKRLQNKKARKYYENYILISQKKALNENIISQIQHFKEKSTSEDPMLYMGKSFGEVPYDSEDYKLKNFKVYVDLSTNKDEGKLANLAIVKLKMEDDFVSYKLNKLIVMLHDYKLITDDEYHLYVYGTKDKEKIRLSKFGLNIGLVSRLQESDQLKNLHFDRYNNLRSSSKFDDYLKTLNDFYKFEIRRFID